jgi:hypothetical protein
LSQFFYKNFRGSLSDFCSAYHKSSRCPITFQCAVWRGAIKTFKRMLLLDRRLDDNLIAIFCISTPVAATYSNFNNICRHHTPSEHRFNSPTSCNPVTITTTTTSTISWTPSFAWSGFYDLIPPCVQLRLIIEIGEANPNANCVGNGIDDSFFSQCVYCSQQSRRLALFAKLDCTSDNVPLYLNGLAAYCQCLVNASA